MKTVIQHPLWGEIPVTRRKGTNRISVSVRPSASIRLSLPYTVSVKEGLVFLNSKEEWIKNTVQKYLMKYPAELISMPYSTREHSLKLLAWDSEIFKINITDSEIIVKYPIIKHYGDDDVQEVIKKGIEEAWRKEAKKLLPARTSDIAKKLGLKYGKITVRNTVSKWGSCSIKNDISLSLHLMRLPDHLIDYIIIHELCHTIHKNHGPSFHNLLNKYTDGKHSLLRKELRNYNTRW